MGSVWKVRGAIEPCTHKLSEHRHGKKKPEGREAKGKQGVCVGAGYGVARMALYVVCACVCMCVRMSACVRGFQLIPVLVKWQCVRVCLISV